MMSKVATWLLVTAAGAVALVAMQMLLKASGAIH
jgi:hypothetical protein